MAAVDALNLIEDGDELPFDVDLTIFLTGPIDFDAFLAELSSPELWYFLRFFDWDWYRRNCGDYAPPSWEPVMMERMEELHLVIWDGTCRCIYLSHLGCRILPTARETWLALRALEQEVP